MKLVRESLDEAYGAGFSVDNNRAFTGSGMTSSGSPISMYTYAIVPLNKKLEPKTNSPSNINKVHLGQEVKGKGLNFGKEYKGTLISSKKNEEGSIMYFILLDEKTSKKVKIAPDSIEILNPTTRDRDFE